MRILALGIGSTYTSEVEEIVTYEIKSREAIK